MFSEPLKEIGNDGTLYRFVKVRQAPRCSFFAILVWIVTCVLGATSCRTVPPEVIQELNHRMEEFHRLRNNRQFEELHDEFVSSLMDKMISPEKFIGIQSAFREYYGECEGVSPVARSVINGPYVALDYTINTTCSSNNTVVTEKFAWIITPLEDGKYKLRGLVFPSTEPGFRQWLDEKYPDWRIESPF